MSNSEALQHTDPSQPPVGQAGITNSVAEVKEVAALMAKSGFFEDAKTAAQAAVKIMAGRELGIPEMAAMRGVYVANGNTELSGPLLAALIKRSDKYDYKAEEVTDERAEIKFYEHGDFVGSASFSIDDAKRAGIHKEDSAWTKYPSDMVFWRALSRGKRRYCPEIGWGATYVWGEGDTKVEQIKKDTAADALLDDGDDANTSDEAEVVEDEPVEDEDVEGEPEDESDTNGDGLPFDEEAKLTPNTRKALNAAGKDVYGDDWDEKRAELVEWFTDGRTDSAAEITNEEGRTILSGIREKQQDDTPEMVTDG